MVSGTSSDSPFLAAIWPHSGQAPHLQSEWNPCSRQWLAGLNARASGIGIVDREQTFHDRPAILYRRNRQDFHIDSAQPRSPSSVPAPRLKSRSRFATNGPLSLIVTVIER